MCEDHYHDPDLQEFDAEEDFDYVEYEPPRKLKYYPASPPLPLSTRLAYYKYAKEFREFMNQMQRLFLPIPHPSGDPLKAKKKHLCVNLRGDAYVLEPRFAEQQTPFTEVEMFGVTQRYPSAPPNITMLTHVVAQNDKALSLKYQNLSHHFQHAQALPANICGQCWYATDMNFDMKPGLSELALTFTLHSNVMQGMHQRMREHEQKNKERFAKQAAF